MNTKSKISLLGKVIEFDGPFVCSEDITPGDDVRAVTATLELDTNLKARKLFQAIKDVQFGDNLLEAVKELDIPNNKSVNRILANVPTLSASDLEFTDHDLKGLSDDPIITAALADIDDEKGYLAALQHAPAISGLTDGIGISKLIDHIASNPNGEVAVVLSEGKDPTEVLTRYNLPGSDSVGVYDIDL